MIKSMTGYGLGSAQNAQVKYTVELKSLNSKFLELNLRIPKHVSDKEVYLRTASAKQIERGKVSLTVTVEHVDPAAQAAQVNDALFLTYFQRLKQLAEKAGIQVSEQELFNQALSMPEVIKQDEEQVNEVEGALLIEAFEKAINAFDTFRMDEGTVLEKDLSERIDSILAFLTEVESKETDRVPMIRERISQYLDRAVGREQVDMNRFEQELIYYIDKLDITEEKVRLRSHCNYFKKALNSEEGNGKKLGFIAQEMGREINTLGSKANHASIQQTVIRMKEELEKIKEQLLNVL